MAELVQKLEALREQDAAYVDRALPWMDVFANVVDLYTAEQVCDSCCWTCRVQIAHSSLLLATGYGQTCVCTPPIQQARSDAVDRVYVWKHSFFQPSAGRAAIEPILGRGQNSAADQRDGRLYLPRKSCGTYQQVIQSTLQGHGHLMVKIRGVWFRCVSDARDLLKLLKSVGSRTTITHG